MIQEMELLAYSSNDFGVIPELVQGGMMLFLFRRSRKIELIRARLEPFLEKLSDKKKA